MLITRKFAIVITLLGLLLLPCCGGESSDNESAIAEQKAPETPEEEVTEALSEAEESQEIGQDTAAGPETQEVAKLEFAPGTPEAELIEAMSVAIEFAESDSIRGLFGRFTPPDDLKRLTDAGQLEVAMKRFRIFRHDFVRALREAQTLQPEFNEDTTRALYEVLEVNVPGNKVAFQKIGKDWYFSD